LLTVVGAAALGVGAFALPAAAQAPVPTAVELDFGPEIVADGANATGGLTIGFGDDFDAGAHDVTAQFDLDVESGLRLFATSPEWGGCGPDASTGQLLCVAEDAQNPVEFAFRYAADADTVEGLHDYTVAIAVDGETVETVEGTIEVLPVDGGSDSPFLYGKADIEIEPGDTYDTGPGFLQTDALPDGTVALAYGVSEPSYILSGLADAIAPYDNCVDGFQGDGGITCIVTDFEDAPGKTFAPNAPISFSVGETVPGPVELCGCSFEVIALDAATLEAEYGDVDTDSGDQLGLDVVSEGDDPEHFFETGSINITTTENPFDLAVSDANAKGAKGAEVTLTVPVKNLGPADAASFFDGPGSYGIIGSLPKGLELVKVDSDGDDIFCFEPDDPTVENSFPDVDPAKTDFVCLFWNVDAKESFDFKFTVKITDASSKAKGTLEIAAIDNDGYPGVADAETKNNTADITVNGSGSGKLPTTGASLTMVVGIAALVLVAGVVLLVVTARRRKAAAE
jgi:LPXTG-motif cell wall-anchored protein